MLPPGGFLLARFLSLPPLALELFPIQGRQCRAQLSELQPGGMGSASFLLVARRHVQRLALALVTKGQVHVRAVPLRRVAVADAAFVAAAAGGFREAALDHLPGGARKTSKKLCLTHI